ncbi:MAG: stage II sporulation protein M [Chloroflexaceae bacterium]|nr:stage II sporulation protein M [Chloroflexaceae bacterium]
MREYQPAGVSPAAYRGDRLSISRFYRREFPALLWELRLPLAVALIAAGSGMALGIWLATNNGYIERILPATIVDQVGRTTYPPSLLLVLFIFLNNIRVSILANVFSLFSFGLFAFLTPFFAFAQVAFVSSMLAVRGGEWLALDDASPLTFLLGYVIPHGIIELPTFILSAAIGLRIGASVLSPPPGFSVAQNILWAFASFAKVWLFVILPLTLVAAMLEGLVTTSVLQSLY